MGGCRSGKGQRGTARRPKPCAAAVNQTHAPRLHRAHFPRHPPGICTHSQPYTAKGSQLGPPHFLPSFQAGVHLPLGWGGESGRRDSSGRASRRRGCCLPGLRAGAPRPSLSLSSGRPPTCRSPPCPSPRRCCGPAGGMGHMWGRGVSGGFRGDAWGRATHAASEAVPPPPPPPPRRRQPPPTRPRTHLLASSVVMRLNPRMALHCGTRLPFAHIVLKWLRQPPMPPMPWSRAQMVASCWKGSQMVGSDPTLARAVALQAL
jgi:hypothetical protein